MGEIASPLFHDIFHEQGGSADPATLENIEELFSTCGPAEVGAHVTPGQPGPRFGGDTSQLPPEACWTLQELVAAPHISEDKSKKHWPVLLQFEDILRSRLSELGLILEINRDRGYAFTRQAEDPSPHSRVLLRARTLSLTSSTLALYLYNQYLVAPDEPVVETSDMVEHMLGYKPADDTDEAAFEKKIHAAIRLLDEAAIIKPVIGTSRYIIHSVITAVLTAERVEALEARYRALVDGPSTTPDGTTATSSRPLGPQAATATIAPAPTAPTPITTTHAADASAEKGDRGDHDSRNDRDRDNDDD
ncbi:DUF4194 domain-containing protein [Nonomuraea sp. NPDC050202]|uniref:DUF4194 domain-containing protein n=1 Tax=Nonomuraea sp. NPDC050202 TaxID=3155035 RepID=UPI0033FF690A